MSNLELSKVNWSDDYFLNNKIDYIFYRGIESSKVNVNDTLYYLSDHPPIGSLFNFKQ